MKREVTLELDAWNSKKQAHFIRDLLQHGCAKSVCETEQEAYETVIDALRVNGLID